MTQPKLAGGKKMSNGNPTLVLIAHPETGIRHLLRLSFTKSNGYRVLEAQNGEYAELQHERNMVDIAFLADALPDVSGTELMRRLQKIKDLPVIMIGRTYREDDEKRCLEEGADDYIAQPINPDIAEIRARVILRRLATPQDAGNSIVKVDNIEIDLYKRTIRRSGIVVSVTRTEWMLLTELAGNAGRVMLNSELLTRVWGVEYRDDLQYLRVWISRLRSKLEDDPAKPYVIQTIPGIGYALGLSDTSNLSRNPMPTAGKVHEVHLPEQTLQQD